MRSTYTDANGNYYFGNLAAGSYTVVVDTTTLPGGGAGLTNTVDPNGGTAQQVHRHAGSQRGQPVQDFGYQYTATQLGSIGDTVWFNPNGNATVGCRRVRHPGRDRGADQGQRTTTATEDDRGTRRRSSPRTVTDANGLYQFNGLPTATARHGRLPGVGQRHRQRAGQHDGELRRDRRGRRPEPGAGPEHDAGRPTRTSATCPTATRPTRA